MTWKITVKSKLKWTAEIYLAGSFRPTTATIIQRLNMDYEKQPAMRDELVQQVRAGAYVARAIPAYEEEYERFNRRMTAGEIEHALEKARNLPRAYMRQSDTEEFYFRAGVLAAEGLRNRANNRT